MRPPLSSRGWPIEAADGQRGLRRFVVLSLLAHAVALMLWPHFRPFSAVDRNRAALSIDWRPSMPSAAAEPTNPHDFIPAPASGEPPRPRPRLTSPSPVGPSLSIPAPRPAEAPPNAQEMIERAKTEIDTASRRRMLDPMFAPPAPHQAMATPLERATARPEAKVEMIRDDILRHTNADGRSYCLQKPPDAATRDGPVPITLVPMYCP